MARCYQMPPGLAELPPEQQEDFIHRWTAQTGIELIHFCHTREEFEDLVQNWDAMSLLMKKISDRRSKQIFGKTNTERIPELRALYTSSKA